MSYDDPEAVRLPAGGREAESQDISLRWERGVYKSWIPKRRRRKDRIRGKGGDHRDWRKRSSDGTRR